MSASFRSKAIRNHGLLVVNHEYTNAEIMFPNFARVEKVTEDGKEEDKVVLGEYTKDLRRY